MCELQLCATSRVCTEGGERVYIILGRKLLWDETHDHLRLSRRRRAAAASASVVELARSDVFRREEHAVHHVRDSVRTADVGADDLGLAVDGDAWDAARCRYRGNIQYI